ncbi:hypothetical protein AW27_018195 [Streptomyces sp. PCS3-D2]|uniref:hypothetical protein n=1 Tax=Streptomyces sp. PCS3-D2 TaxID=1460244 RepID=UPI000445F443|nr:hypothetical protein [Streptomyces sp. PCS3-D2]WKV73281.1 hypothetical protein AW27_018195 [Streptomyces sp. PCS3-D2]
MSEHQNETAPVPAPAPAPEPAPEPVTASVPAPAPEPVAAPVSAVETEPAPVRRKKNRRTLALVSAAVAVVVLAGGAVAAAAALADADRTSPTRYWVAEDHTTGGTQAPVPTVPPNELTGKLMPMPADYWPGPDLDPEGNDYFLPSDKALQSFKDARTGLSSSERSERDRELADLKLKGMAGRSYARSEGYGAAVAEIRLIQADPQQLASFGEFAKKLIELTGDGGAPQVEGYPQAKCGLDGSLTGGKDGKEKIDALDCVAVEGDVLVSFRMYGSEGFAVKDAASLFKQQLDHLKSPGESA